MYIPTQTISGPDTFNECFESASPQKILQWAIEQYRGRITLGTGLGPSGIVLIHMLKEIEPDPDIFFLDTGLHFQESYTLVEQLEERLSVRIRRVQPRATVSQQAEEQGPQLWTRDPNLCCQLRKVEPLRAHLASYDAWVTGIRRDQGATRASTPIVRYVSSYDVVKINPLATWTEERVWSYIYTYGLPYNLLHDRGYPSVGCEPCTQPVKNNGSPRAGRWAGFNKTECGLHLV